MPNTTKRPSITGRPVCADCGGWLPGSCVCPPAVPLSKTGKAYILDMHQLHEGDLLRWWNPIVGDAWYTVQTIVRNPDAPNHLTVTAHLHSADFGFATATGQECQSVTVIPRIFVVRTVS